MPSTAAKKVKEIYCMLRQLSPKDVERLRNYAVYLELEEIVEEEPLLTPEEDERIAVARAEINEGKGRPFKEVLNELW